MLSNRGIFQLTLCVDGIAKITEHHTSSESCVKIVVDKLAAKHAFEVSSENTYCSDELVAFDSPIIVEKAFEEGETVISATWICQQDNCWVYRIYKYPLIKCPMTYITNNNTGEVTAFRTRDITVTTSCQ